MFHRFRRNHDRQTEVLVVPRHADIMQTLGNPVARNSRIKLGRARKIAAAFFIEAAIAGKGACNLTDTVSAEVEADAGIVVANGRHRHAASVAADKWHHKLVGYYLVVGILYPLHRVRILTPFPPTQDPPALLLRHTLPSAVPDL